MSKEHNVTYFLTEISLLLADASSSFFTNTREFLFMAPLYMSNVFKWNVCVRSFRRLCHFEPKYKKKRNHCSANECLIRTSKIFVRFQWSHLYSTRDLHLAKVLACYTRDLWKCFVYWIKVPIKITIIMIIDLFYSYSICLFLYLIVVYEYRLWFCNLSIINIDKYI